jgi:hypothetical protein
VSCVTCDLLVRQSLELSRGLEAQPFVRRHCLAPRVDRYMKGHEVCGVLQSSLHESRTDSLASLLGMTQTLWMSADSRLVAPGLGTRRTTATQGHADGLSMR